MADNADDLRALTQPDHWMGWLGDDPGKAVRDMLETTLRDQVAEAKLLWVHLQDEPHFLTGGRPVPDDDTKITVVRAGLAVGFELAVDDGAGNVEELQGVFSWVATGLDTADARRDQTYFDLGADLAAAREELETRIYTLEDG